MAWRRVYKPHALVLLPALERESWVESVTVWLAESAHQVAEVTVRHTLNPAFPVQSWRTPAGAVWAENAAVHLRYGWYSDDSGDFYGYVASSRVVGSESDPAFGYASVVRVVYTLVGASMPMQSRRNRVWRDCSASSMATTVATEHTLQPHVDLTAVHFDQRTQAKSDWVFLAVLAEAIGYRLFVDATTLWFVKRTTVLPASDGSVPSFWQRKQPGVINSLREYSGVVGDTDPAGGLRSRYSTVSYNREAGKLSSAVYAQLRTDVRGDAVAPLIAQQYTNLPATSYDQATTLLAADTTYLWVESRAVTNGDPRLRPGSLVDLQGDGVGDQNVGLWMVRSAVHRIAVNHADARRTDYSCELVLGRNDAARLSLPTQDRPPVTAPTILVGGVWRAQFTGAGK